MSIYKVKVISQMTKIVTISIHFSTRKLFSSETVHLTTDTFHIER